MLSEWQERVTKEKAQLDDRLERLKKFLSEYSGKGKGRMELKDLSLLKMQEGVMERYSEILGQRIARFTIVEA